MEKLEFINVVTMDTGVMDGITTIPFPSTNIPAQQEAAKLAEDHFTNLVKGIDDELTDEEVSEYLDDSSYRDPQGGKEVHIIWSDNSMEPINTASAAKTKG